MTVWINGEERPLLAETLAELFGCLVGDAQPTGVAIALNDEIIPRCEWAGTPLRSGDRIEIVGAVAGG